jgi:putative Ca2+/H+ antiporter (TMEM165/GDT1 family)
MDWRVILTTFGVIFLAELGDKTQLAAMTLAAQTRRPWAVFIGASVALACDRLLVSQSEAYSANTCRCLGLNASPPSPSLPSAS